MQLDTLFEKIDEYFSGKKPSEASIMFFLVGAVIVFIVYSYIFPPAETFLKTNEKNLKEMTKKVNQEQSYLKSVTRNGDPEFYVKQMRADIETGKINLERATYMNGFVDNKLKELSYLLFNDKNWAKFLDELTFLAKKYNVRLTRISNEFNEPNLQKIEQVLNITLELNGGFNDILKFLNAIEESQLIVDVNALNIEGKKGLEGSMKIAVWGMKY